MQKKKVYGLTLFDPDFKTCYHVTVTKSGWHWCENRQIQQRSHKHPEMDPHIHSHLFSTKGTKLIHGERTVLPTNDAVTTGHTHAKTLTLNTLWSVPHTIQNNSKYIILTQNISEVNEKYIRNLTVKPENIKFLEKHTRENHSDLRLDFLDLTSKTRSIKEEQKSNFNKI